MAIDAGDVKAFTSGIGHVIESKIFQKALDDLTKFANLNIPEYLKKVGKTKFSPEMLRGLYAQHGLEMKFTDDTWPEELSRLGIRYIPDFDYWGTKVASHLSDPTKAATLRDVILNNQRVVANLHTNPELMNVLGRPLDIDPTQAYKWYSKLGNQMQRNWSVPRKVASALRGRLSGGTPFDKETASAINIIEDPNNMFRAGNQNTELAVRQLLRNMDWIEDPRLWSPKGAQSKTFNYAMNYIDPLNPQFVTNDIHQFAIGTGLAKAMGSEPEQIFASKKLYDLWSDVTRQVANEMGMLPNEAQALMWTIWRDLMSGDVSGFQRGRQLILAPEVADAIAGKPKSLLDAMGRAARNLETEKIDAANIKFAGQAAKLKQELAAAKNQADRRVATTKKMANDFGVKLDPKIKALLILLGAGGVGAASRKPSEETSAMALGRMQ